MGERGGLPCPVLKIEKITLILEKKVLIVSILGLNLPLKMYLGEKAPKFFFAGSFLCVFDERFIEVP